MHWQVQLRDACCHLACMVEEQCRLLPDYLPLLLYTVQCCLWLSASQAVPIKTCKVYVSLFCLSDRYYEMIVIVWMSRCTLQINTIDVLFLIYSLIDQWTCNVYIVYVIFYLAVCSFTYLTSSVTCHCVWSLGDSWASCRNGLTLWRPLLTYGYIIKNLMPDRVKPSFVIFDIRTLWRSGLSVRVPGCQKLQMSA